MVKVGDKVWVVYDRSIHATSVKSVGVKFIYVHGERYPFFKDSLRQKAEYKVGRLATSHEEVTEILETRRATELKNRVIACIWNLTAPYVVLQIAQVLNYPIPDLPEIPMHLSSMSDSCSDEILT